MKNIWLVLVLLLVPSLVFAGTATITVTEPDQDGNGNPLNDLGGVRLNWHQDNGPENIITIPASSIRGGQSHERKVTVADPPPCGKTTISVTAVAFDLSGNVSPEAAASTTRDVTLEVACVTPKEPKGLSITVE